MAGALLGSIGASIGDKAVDFGLGLIKDKLQHKRYKEDRDYMNQYNSPRSQVQRFRDAGLNPQLALGDPGNQAAGPIGLGEPSASEGTLSRYNQKRMADAQVDLTQREADYKKVMTDKETTQNAILNANKMALQKREGLTNEAILQEMATSKLQGRAAMIHEKRHSYLLYYGGMSPSSAKIF